jgi:Cytochrome C assembly protein
MSFLSGMTITCFAACYVLALAVEVSRLLMRWRVPTIVPLALAAIGLLAHSLYLIAQAQHELAQRVISPLSSWYDFCLLAAWVLAGAYLGLTIRRSENAIGVFLLPLILTLIAAAAFVQDADPFPARTANVVWRWVHGMTLLLGTTAVTLGFATGLMYLMQSYRLKHKLPPRGFRLPSLEWLQRFNREALFVSTCLLAIGLVSGVALNLISKAGQGTVSWTDPVVLSSGVLFLWLTIVTIFESIYRPAREGSKVAYLTLANFVFLALALCFVLYSSHATANATAPPATRSVSEERGPDSLRSSSEAACLRRPCPAGAEHISPGQRPGFGADNALVALKVRNNGHAKLSSRPFRALDAVLVRLPRALPWAGMLLPPRGERTYATSDGGVA